MGCLPMRDISPDLRDDLAADAVAARVVTGHQSVGSGDDRGAHAAEYARDVLRGDVGAAAGLRHPVQAGDDRSAVPWVISVGVGGPPPRRAAGGATPEWGP